MMGYNTNQQHRREQVAACKASQRASGRCKEVWRRVCEYLPELPPEPLVHSRRGRSISVMGLGYQAAFSIEKSGTC